MHRMQRCNNRLASRNPLEIRIFDLERHGSTVEPFCLTALPDFFDERCQFGASLVEIIDVRGKRIFGPYGLPFPVRLDGPIIYPSRNPVIPATRLTKMLGQKRQRLGLQIRTGLNAEPFHLSGCYWPNAVEFLDGKSFDCVWVSMPRWQVSYSR